MVAPNTTYPFRLSPSGPEIGTPPQQIGIGDGSGQIGRTWHFQGAGTTTQVPGTVAGDVLNLAALPVNLLNGYHYDVEFIGFTGGTGGQYKANVLGSVDNGATYTVVLLAGPDNALATDHGAYVARDCNVGVASNVVIDHVTVQWQRAVPAGADLTYEPKDCSLVIHEYSLT